MRAYPSVMTLLSPLQHTELTVGVDAKFRRVPFIGPGGARIEAPILSGNSIRGLLRRAAAKTVLEICDVPAESLSIETFDLVFAGGALDVGASGHTVPLDKVRAAQRAFPPLALFGGSLGAHVLPGSIHVDMAIPIVKELEPWTGVHSDVSLWDVMHEIPYARRDERVRDEKSRTQMRYTVECLAAGTMLAHGARLYTDDPALIGCFWDAVERVAAERSLGGRGAIGHGRFEWTWTAPEGIVDEYREQLIETREETSRFLGAVAVQA
jgi:hypothetical protein